MPKNDFHQGTCFFFFFFFFFFRHCQRGQTQEVPPVIYTNKYYLISIFRDGLFLVAAVKADVPPLLVMEFLHRVVDVFLDYFGAVDEVSAHN